MLGRVVTDVPYATEAGALINRPPPRDDRPCPQARVELSEYGNVTEAAIHEITSHYERVVVDKYVIMPNHIHMILRIRPQTCTGDYQSPVSLGDGRSAQDGGRLIIAPTGAVEDGHKTISIVIQQLKRQITKQIGFSMWQKSFHDNIIDSEREYQAIWQYIDENPAKWAEDEYCPRLILC